jgi:hypothetical protein
LHGQIDAERRRESQPESEERQGGGACDAQDVDVREQADRAPRQDDRPSQPYHRARKESDDDGTTRCVFDGTLPAVVS